MRMIWAILVAATLVLTGCGTASAADFTLRYVSPTDASDTLTIEGSSDGRMRIEDGRGQWMIIRDGQTYFRVQPPGQDPIVARLDDFMVVGAEMRANFIRNGVLDPSAARQRYQVRPQGARAVGQWRGTAFEVGPVEESGALMNITISDNPAFADIRERVVAAMQAFDQPPRSVLIESASYERLVAQTLARGMPITYNGMDLRAVRRDPVSPARFDLPSQPVTRDALRATLIR